MAAPAYRAHTDTGSASATSRVGTKPTGTTTDDIILALLYVGGSDDIAVTAPSGFTQKVMQDNDLLGKQFRLYLYWKRAGGSEPADYTFSWSGSHFSTLTLTSISGCITSGDPFDVTTSGEVESNTNTGPTLSMTTTEPDTLLFFGDGFYEGGTKTHPSGFTVRFDGGSSNTNQTSDLAQASAGGTGNLNSSNAGTPGPICSIMGALKPAAGGAAAPKRLTLLGVG